MRSIITLGALVSGAAAQAGAWAQCGGSGWTGATSCVSGYTCTVSNQWYSQCLPGSGSSNPPASTTLATSVKPTSTTAPGAGSWRWFGTNEAGGEFGEKTLPGTWGKEFIFPDPATITVSSLPLPDQPHPYTDKASRPSAGRATTPSACSSRWNA